MNTHPSSKSTPDSTAIAAIADLGTEECDPLLGAAAVVIPGVADTE